MGEDRPLSEQLRQPRSPNKVKLDMIRPSLQSYDLYSGKHRNYEPSYMDDC